ncbi:hypothetical protein [Pyrococcus sp.]|uniref:hypothetical protein n=1 Tax=Pyrococcus sp. TaxID=33866 RepID=UPI00258FC2CC|nr:hypothetical protein [Pyrococcus sp.]
MMRLPEEDVFVIRGGIKNEKRKEVINFHLDVRELKELKEKHSLSIFIYNGEIRYIIKDFPEDAFDKIFVKNWGFVEKIFKKFGMILEFRDYERESREAMLGLLVAGDIFCGFDRSNTDRFRELMEDIISTKLMNAWVHILASEQLQIFDDWVYRFMF